MPCFYSNPSIDFGRLARCRREVEAAMRAAGWQSSADKFDRVATKRALRRYWETAR